MSTPYRLDAFSHFCSKIPCIFCNTLYLKCEIYIKKNLRSLMCAILSYRVNVLQCAWQNSVCCFLIVWTKSFDQVNNCQFSIIAHSHNFLGNRKLIRNLRVVHCYHTQKNFEHIDNVYILLLFQLRRYKKLNIY